MTLYKNIKGLLADSIEEITLNSKDALETYSVNLVKSDPGRKLLLAVMGTELSELDEFEVMNIFVGVSGFMIDLELTEEALEAIHKISAEYRVPVVHTVYPAE